MQAQARQNAQLPANQTHVQTEQPWAEPSELHANKSARPTVRRAEQATQGKRTRGGLAGGARGGLRRWLRRGKRRWLRCRWLHKASHLTTESTHVQRLARDALDTKRVPDAQQQQCGRAVERRTRTSNRGKMLQEQRRHTRGQRTAQELYPAAAARTPQRPPTCRARCCGSSPAPPAAASAWRATRRRAGRRRAQERWRSCKRAHAQLGTQGPRSQRHTEARRRRQRGACARRLHAPDLGADGAGPHGVNAEACHRHGERGCQVLHERTAQVCLAQGNCAHATQSVSARWPPGRARANALW